MLPPSASPLHVFLHALHAIRSTGAGTQETSYYGPLENLLNAVGSTLTIPVRAVFQLQDMGAGHPDFGLFSVSQYEKTTGQRIEGIPPERGVGEVKSPAESLTKLLEGQQVSKYWKAFRQVLVTNLRQFAFVAEDAFGAPLVVDACTLAPTEADFWERCAHPTDIPAAEVDAFTAFLTRCLRHAAPLEQPRDVAWFLASYARESRDRLSLLPSGQLHDLSHALGKALNLRFEGEKGQRLFQATVVQTLFYGVFSAWVLWDREKPERTDRFDWRTASEYLPVLVVQVLYEQLSSTSQVKALGLRDLLERAALLLNRVRRARFFARLTDRQAIQYFYEPFLEAYDPQLRKELGVWYTPPDLVKYMVARVDHVLREQLGILDGLADPSVVVLDPCCGTGTYLLEVIEFIRRRLDDLYPGDGANGMRLQEAATTRLFGFELMTAPFVIAHLQIGLALRAAGAPLTDEKRAAVYLTNALTGWEPAQHEKQLTVLSALAKEADLARHVKREEQVVVVLGNPPYSGYAGLAIDEERALTDAYRHPKRTTAPQGQGLNDLYVRFFRIAERQIAERSGRGLVCYVSNSSWLDGLSHPGLRERLLDAFDHIWIDNLNGDKYRTGKTTPEGAPDPSVFSTPFNREGIQVGTAIALLARTGAPTGPAKVEYRNFWGREKLDQLAAHAAEGIEGNLRQLAIAPNPYQSLFPDPLMGLPLIPRTVSHGYMSNPTLTELFPVSFAGVKTSRDEALVDVSKANLEARMKLYFDPSRSAESVAKQIPRLFEPGPGFDPLATRQSLIKRGISSGHFIRYLYRPFDLRWLYWHPETKLLDRGRPEFVRGLFANNLFLEARQRNPSTFDRGMVTSTLGDNLGNGLSSYFPLYLSPDIASGESPTSNLSKLAHDYIGAMEIRPKTLFYHVIAVLHASDYRTENAGALQQDWPRVPLPYDGAVLEQSAVLGRRMAELLDVAQPVIGITHGSPAPDVQGLGVLRHITPSVAITGANLAVRARWGMLGHTGQVMPGPGLRHLETVTSFRSSHLGHEAYRIHLNDEVYWANVPRGVWEYTLGGYQVLKKWLSYRSFDVIGRPLVLEEVEEFSRIVRRIAALLLLTDELNANYARMHAPSEAPMVEA